MRKFLKPISLLAVLIVLTATVTSCSFEQNDTIDIDLNKYISIQFDGLSGNGTAAYNLNEEQLRNDYYGYLFLKNSTTNSIEDAEDAIYCFLGQISGFSTLSPDSGLSNGDTVTFSWNLDTENLESTYNISVSCDDIVKTVSGLEESNFEIVNFHCDKEGQTLYPDSGQTMLFESQIRTNYDPNGWNVVLVGHDNRGNRYEYRMNDDGNEGDEMAGDKIYSVLIKNEFEDIGSVAWHVEANGLTSENEITTKFEKPEENTVTANTDLG